MPEDTKKQQKSKNDPKDQRKRRGRQPASASDKKLEKDPDVPKSSDTKVPDKPQKPAHEPPPPEFYKNLKRETEEIIKITEEANSKYKKKEILSNWSKYEMPIDSYDDIDEQENLGADYETLASAPLSVGSHFQFKHEKSWDTNTGPTVYDKYFEINMQRLNTALSTIPFFERNNIDISLFSETDIQNMNQRATKFKQKYYKDKKYTTPELEAQEKILNSLTKSDDNNEQIINQESQINFDKTEYFIQDNVTGSPTDAPIDVAPKIINNSQFSENKPEIDNSKDNKTVKKVVEKKANETHVPKPSIEEDSLFEDDILTESSMKSKKKITCEEVVAQLDQVNLAPKNEVLKAPTATATNPVIESPEDLEKWLDDFLDG